MSELILPHRIIFAPGSSNKLAEHAGKFGKRCLLVCGSNPQRHAQQIDKLQQSLSVETFSVANEPDIAAAQAGAEQAKQFRTQLVIGLGGGSVIDAAKAIAALATNEGSPLTYLEVVGQGKPLQADPLPCIAVPTTAGTGSEATKNAVLTVPEKQRKVSMRDARMLPDIALVDPLLLRSVPQKVAAAAGIDAFIQCAETFLCAKPNPLVDPFCREGIKRSSRSLLAACNPDPSDEVLCDMAYASLAGGIALANAKLGAVHGFAGVIGGITSSAHGAICGCLAPYVFTANLHALRNEDSKSSHIARFDEIGQLIAGQQAGADEAVAWIGKTVKQLELPNLAALGIAASDVDMIAEKAQASSSMAGNPVVLEKQELAKILKQALMN